MNKFKLFTGVAMLGLTFAMSSCVRKDFDAPPDNSQYDPQLPVNTTIEQLKAMVGPYTSSTSYDDTTFASDLVISGVVTADDRSGNYYKQIVIQDATGGIAININNYSLYTHYPVGRKLYIKLNGMTLSYDGGNPVLGLGLTEQRAVKGLESSDIDAHIIRGNIGNVVKDTVITLAQAKAANPFFYNRLVTVSDVEFLDTTRTYTAPEAATNRYLVNCAYNNPSTAEQLVTRNSNYANFHGLTVPSGHGSVTGIFTVFISSSRTAQILIRDTSDVKLNQPRCNGNVTPPPPTNSPLITIDSLRKLYPGSGNYTVPTAKIAGIVISDIDNKNVSSGNFIIEDASRKGVIMYISGSSAYKLGDSVVVEVTGATLKVYPTTGSGSLEIDGLTAAKVTKVSSNNTFAPLQVTIGQLNANFSLYESTLVKIVNATVTGTGTYSGNKNITDGTGTLALYTAPGALFSGQALPTGVKTFIGIATPFSPTNEIKLRNPAIDVQ